MISILVFTFFVTLVLPELCYSFAAMDRHYFGYFHEPEPYHAKTTANEKYYAENNIPYVTSRDIHKHYEIVRHNRSKGLPTDYEINHR